jgi:hypothetical protein
MINNNNNNNDVFLNKLNHKKERKKLSEILQFSSTYATVTDFAKFLGQSTS